MIENVDPPQFAGVTMKARQLGRTNENMITYHEKEQIAFILHSYFGGVNDVLWKYISLLLGRKLTLEDKIEIATKFLGWKEDHARG